jgi:hypothetical protein
MSSQTNNQIAEGTKFSKHTITIGLAATFAVAVASAYFFGEESENTNTAEPEVVKVPTEPKEEPVVVVAEPKPVKTINIAEVTPIEKPERPHFKDIPEMPRYFDLPDTVEELPRMSYKPEPLEILAYAEAYIPEITPPVLDETLIRIESENQAVSAQATKDLGYFLANGRAGMPESDALANSFYEAALENSDGQNIQAAHDLGYHLLHGKGIEQNYERAYELLNQANDGGHPLSKPMLDYMSKHKLNP